MPVYNLNVVITLVSSYKNNEDYVLWIDTESRMWETINGVNKEIKDTYERRKYEKLFLGFTL
ncbi:hypothetical protein [Halalkalibacter oceani]|uniref:hypothetical protein n=1 Tax=Halalkalibacter oceani TaxID=1653776 RepID=UPI003392D5A7